MRVQARKPTKKPARRASPRLAEHRRRDIVEQAVRLMEEKGFAAMSVRHVADALEFSKANFYHHIESKEKLLYEIFVDTLQSAIRRIGDIVAREQPAPEKLRALIEFYVSLMTERRAVMLVWFKERAHLNDEHQQAVTALETQVTDLLRTFYTRGMDDGYFKRMDVDILRMAVFGMCFLLTKLPDRPDGPAIETITRQLQELVTTGLLAPAGSA
jgi:AcrR family transcriptional regulator